MKVFFWLLEIREVSGYVLFYYLNLEIVQLLKVFSSLMFQNYTFLALFLIFKYLLFNLHSILVSLQTLYLLPLSNPSMLSLSCPVRSGGFS